ncbi:MAG: hypothetical protein ACREMN_13275 [Gemmatimonadales bacterium]
MTAGPQSLTAPSLALELTALTILLFIGACRSTGEPERPVTLLVTNATCATGACQPIDMRGLLPTLNVPQPIGGLLDLGRVEDPTACLTIPPSYTLTVSSPTETTTMTWTVHDPVSLHAFAVPFEPVGSTVEFVPASSAGWSVIFPSDGNAGTLRAASACAS